MTTRVKIWYEKLANREPFPELGAMQASSDLKPGGADPFNNNFHAGLGEFQADDLRQPLLLKKDTGPNGGCLKVTNLASGGQFALAAVTTRFNASEHPVMRFRYKIPANVRVNVYVKARGLWNVIRLTGSAEVTAEQRVLGAIEGAAADNAWHEARFNLGPELTKTFGSDVEVERVVFGMMEPEPYLYTGLTGINLFGASWWLDDFQLGR